MPVLDKRLNLPPAPPLERADKLTDFYHPDIYQADDATWPAWRAATRSAKLEYLAAAARNGRQLL